MPFKNSEDRKRNSRIYYERNKEKINNRILAYRAAHPNRIRKCYSISGKKWYDKNKRNKILKSLIYEAK